MDVVIDCSTKFTIFNPNVKTQTNQTNSNSLIIFLAFLNNSLLFCGDADGKTFTSLI